MMSWILVAATVVLLVVVQLRFFRSRSSIPVVPGIPLLGNAIALGKGGLAFITQCRQRFGDVFCLHVLGQRMVFVFDPAMLSLFLKAPEASISFKPAVEQFTQRIYGLPSSEFFSRHEELLATLRQLLVSAQLQGMGRQLLDIAQQHLQQWQGKEQLELWSACQSLVFASAGQVFFGAPFFRRHGLQTVQEAFLEFEGQFEIAASPVPHLLLPRFRRSRAALLSMFSTSLAAGDFEHTFVGQLLLGCGLPERLWPNLLLAVMWASQANSMPAMFWSLAMLLLPEHAEARAKVLTELHETAAHIRQQTQQQQQQHNQQQQHVLDEAVVSAMLSLAMDKRSWVSCCVAEAIRLRAHSIAVRFVSDDNLILLPTAGSNGGVTGFNGSSSSSSSSIAAGGVAAGCGTMEDKAPPHSNGSCQQRLSPAPAALHVPRGSILCICPMESHHDQRLYPDEPWLFKPNRAPIQGLLPGTVVVGVAGMGFGGGYWRCPGRFFAEMELSLLVQLVLFSQDLTPVQTQQQPPQQQQQQAQLAGQQHSEDLDRSNHQQAAAAVSSAALGFHQLSDRPALHSLLTAVLPQRLQQGVFDAAAFGLGACAGSRRQQQQWRASGVAAAAADDCDEWSCGRVLPAVRLPDVDVRRLVGFKVPAEPWWVRVRRPGSRKVS